MSSTKHIAQALANAQKLTRGLEELRGMPYFGLMLSELKRVRLKPRGPCGQSIPSPYDYANDALAKLLAILEGGEP